MTLQEWAKKQPVKVSRHGVYFNSFWVPDVDLVDRSAAWRLDDYIESLESFMTRYSAS